MGVFSYCEQKTKTPKSAENIEFTALLLFCRKIFMSLSLYVKEFKSVGVFQGLYRQSGLYRNFRYGFFISAFLQDYS